jgi:putative sterol carrier protein
MDVGNMCGMGLLGGAVFGGGLLVNSLMTGGGWKKLLTDLYKKIQKDGEEKIAGIAQKQTKIEVKIKKDEKLSENKKQKIKDIASKASKEIDDVLKETNIEIIQDSIDTDWGDL